MNFNFKNKQLKEYYYPNDEGTYFTFNTLYIIMKNEIVLKNGFDYINIFPNINKL